MRKRTLRAPVDYPFLIVASILVLLGIGVFTSAALGTLARSGEGQFASVATSQFILGLLMGGAGMVVAMYTPFQLLRKYAPYFFGFAVVLTCLVWAPHIGLSLKGAARWVMVGPVSFQPEELLKLATLMFLASIYATYLKKVNTLRGGLLPLLIIAGGAAGLLVAQPNTAGALILLSASTVVFMAAGGRWRDLGLLALSAVLVVGAAALYYPHVRDRLATYFQHSDSATNVLGDAWQSNQSFIAIGSGGIFGRGFGQSIEKFSYLPEPIGDSIFAVLGEEFGLIGTTLFTLLFLTFGVLGLRIAARVSDPFGALLVVGLTALIVGQSFANMASATGVIPLIGVPLIFVSHGGTALAMALIEVGIILSVSRSMRRSDVS